LFYEADRGPRLAALPENRPRRNQVAPVCRLNCSFGPVESIVSERVELRALDVDALGALLERSDLQDRRFFELRRRELAAQPELLGWFVWAVVVDDELVGHAGFHGPPGRNAQNDAEAVEIGYTIYPQYRRRGYATEAARALIAWANEQHGIRRFLFSIAPDNEPSLAIARRLGFSEVGRHWDEEDGEELEFELRLE
jgi:ribosomal-protein-alanine N-acetyltransferase